MLVEIGPRSWPLRRWDAPSRPGCWHALAVRGQVDGQQRSASVGSRVNARAIPGSSWDQDLSFLSQTAALGRGLHDWHQGASRAGAATPHNITPRNATPALEAA